MICFEHVSKTYAGGVDAVLVGEALMSARSRSDAVAATREVFRALGMDDEYERKIFERRKA